MKQKVFNLIILDESGSMSCIHHQSVEGVNETFNTIRNSQKENADQEQLVTFVTFNSNGIKTIYDKAPIAEVNALTDKDFRPSSCTPLYDAMGISLTKLRDSVADTDLALITIVTDGYENASREYSGKAIKALVDSLRQEHDWIFTYIGANQNVEEVAASLGVSNSMAFCEDAEGTRKMWEKESNSRRNFFHRSSEVFADLDCCTMTSEDLKVRKKRLAENYFVDAEEGGCEDADKK